jgi:cytochrome c biogenesis protein CcmG/thiol:disulfide interchange protein DsbE
MTRRGRLLLGAAVIVLALGALILTGVRQSVVYFVTPSELMAQDKSAGRAYRLGGMVVQGSLQQNPTAHEQRFLLTDGKASVPVYHRGIPPDLFAEGRGAVVEGKLAPTERSTPARSWPSTRGVAGPGRRRPRPRGALHSPPVRRQRRGEQHAPVKLRARWLIPFAALPVVGLLAYGFRTDPRAVPSPLVGRPAPPFALTTFDGKAVSLEAQRGKVVVLNFWASWCYPACYEEAPVLEASWRRVAPEGVVVLGVAIQDKDPASLEFIQRFGITFPNAPDPAGKVSIDYGVYGVPETFVIDRRGVIRRKHVGAVTEAVFREWVEPLLKESV